MITCRTCGRLGNFMFQFSATYCHALKYGFDYCMPLRSMNEKAWPTPKIGRIKYGSPQPGKTFKQPTHAYHPIPNEDNLTLEGYWQSEKYWHGYKEQIAEALGFVHKPEPYVAVHIRRGDYLKYPDQFPVMPLDYYKFAMEFMGSITDPGYHKFRIYSDDIKWCMEVFDPKNKLLNYMAFNAPLHIEFSENKDPLTDMKDMYNASAFIIGNSTFSLFPALLRCDNPMVIAPAENHWPWCGKNGSEASDLMPERFIKINANELINNRTKV